MVTMRVAVVCLLPFAFVGVLASGGNFAQKPDDPYRDQVCEEFRDYCTVRNECAYTFLFPKGESSCPEISEAVTGMQGMTDTQSALEDRIQLLLETNSQVLERLEDIENRFEMRGGRIWRQIRRDREESGQHIKKLNRKHKWQAKKIKRGREEIERLKSHLNFTFVEEPKQTIGLTVHPSPNALGLIHFNPQNEESHSGYTHHIDNLLNMYMDDNEISPYDTCPPGVCPDEEEGRLCRYPISNLGEHCSTPGYGYQEGKPCLYISLEKVDGWKPQPFAPEEVPEEIKDIYDPNYVTITCHAKTNEEEIDMGKVRYHPAHGLGAEYFPYIDDEEEANIPFQTPLVALQFPTLSQNVPVKIVCKAWAANINLKKGSLEGKVHFTLHVHDGELKMSDMEEGDN